MTIPESNEVAGHQYRLAQANRFIRHCAELGVNPSDVMEGRVEIDLGPIRGEDGKIKPEPIDLDEVPDTVDAELELMLSKAAIALIESTPGATSLGDVERKRNQPFENLLAAETGLPLEQVLRITGKPFEAPS